MIVGQGGAAVGVRQKADTRLAHLQPTDESGCASGHNTSIDTSADQE